MRSRIIARDKVCQDCGGVRYERMFWGEISYEYYEGFGSAPYCRLGVSWHVDHIKPIIEGGTDDPANLRLLCGQCHKRITKEWHGKRAKKRRPQLELIAVESQ